MSDSQSDRETRVFARSISADPVKTKADKKKRTDDRRPLTGHVGGGAVVLAATMMLAVGLLPLLFDRFRNDAFQDAATVARNVGPSWPGSGDPGLWPNALATFGFWTAALVVVLAVSTVRVPKIAVLVAGLVVALPLAATIWSTIDVFNDKHWISLPASLVCVVAFLLAARASTRWKANGGSSGSIVKLLLGGVVLAGLILVAGTAIVVNAQESKGVSSTLISR